MKELALKYYDELAQRIEAVLKERLNGDIGVLVSTDDGFVCTLENEVYSIYFSYSIAIRLIEAKQNDAVLWCANEFITKYEEYVLTQIIYR